MSTQRTAGWVRITYNPETRRAYCKNCGTECPDRARIYCTDDCREDYSVRNFPSHARLRVWERDKGICALCGTDTNLTTVRRLGHWMQTNWEMDHIVPVVEGGGQCGLDNLRTLCIPCHRQVTRELRQRLASGRNKPSVAANTMQIALFSDDNA